MRDDDKLDRFSTQVSHVRSGQAGITIAKRLDAVGDDLDSTLNFRVNSGLKSEFEKICRNADSNVARELKRYMRAAIHLGRVL